MYDKDFREIHSNIEPLKEIDRGRNQIVRVTRMKETTLKLNEINYSERKGKRSWRGIVEVRQEDSSSMDEWWKVDK